MKIGDRQTLLLTGDSITDGGRERPIGRRNGLGSGYVNMVDALLASCCLEKRVRVLSTGIGGNRVTDLEARWQTDVLDLEPDWLSVLIGINDVWRHFDNLVKSDQVSSRHFEDTYRRILHGTRPKLKGLVLMTPYFIEANRSDPMRKMMDEYGAVVQKLASEFDAVFVDLQAAFDRYLRHHPSQSLCGDRIHPNAPGHMIIATSLLTALGLDWATLKGG
jgi:lysophospholipase L1-like esterase